MSKSPVSKISIIRTEGPAGSDFGGHEFTGFADAQRHLVSISQTAPGPDEGGYDKVEFRVEWENGETYAGRYDLVRGAGDQLCDQVANTCTFYLGLRKPAHMSAEDYTRFLGCERAQRAAVGVRPIFETCTLEWNNLIGVSAETGVTGHGNIQSVS